ncbi:PREDICTED: olfactory receptor 52K1-like [Nanorana parkeri]|uniref:olfactory receptor 52K1-like n=1 Tax=Nanorana parkeri TaxID=125878 RepID=UPI000855083B|nr:PREDICTED: olfactory receptor 52K1-like [Nanorana parkeri]XP_018430760.1 PREDICTED: olfactory receptor 52K1-like [Nanorana parkeri]
MGNCTMAYIIWMEKTLHQPMYILISLVFSVNVSYAMTIMPKFLLGLMFGLEQITLVGCLTQMFFMYIAGTFNSNLLLLMAVDRYVAIVLPLRYHLLMTMKTLAFLVFLSSLRNFLFVSLIVGFASKVQFCGSNIILNFACENMSLLNLGCGDISGVQAVGLWVRIFLVMVDGTFVVLSYMRILHTVMKLVAGRARDKARQTCSAHLLVTMLTYFFGLSSSIIYRMGSVISNDVQNTTSLLNYVIPAAADPIIYGVKMKEIRNSLKKRLSLKITNNSALR